MDLSFLNNALKQTLDQFHLDPKIRYKNIAFSSRIIADLNPITQSLSSLLPEYPVWKTPGEQGAPQFISSLKFILECIADVKQEGVIIHKPEEWTNNLPLLEKQAFWSALGMWQKPTKVVLVCAESNEFHKSNSAYFNPQIIDGFNITLWRPKRADQS